jgi:hypothetical protein
VRSVERTLGWLTRGRRFFGDHVRTTAHAEARVEVVVMIRLMAARLVGGWTSRASETVAIKECDGVSVR